MREPIPAWLTAAQNGAVGEARTKALLLDRFWVLERSVDVEGALAINTVARWAAGWVDAARFVLLGFLYEGRWLG